MITVKFIDVGRNKLSWTATCAEVGFDWLCKQVLSRVPIKDIAEGLSFRNEHGSGTIYAGVRAVGRFIVVSERAKDARSARIVTETITNQGGGR